MLGSKPSDTDTKRCSTLKPGILRAAPRRSPATGSYGTWLPRSFLKRLNSRISQPALLLLGLLQGWTDLTHVSVRSTDSLPFWPVIPLELHLAANGMLSASW
jgi:hypothetical protein